MLIITIVLTPIARFQKFSNHCQPKLLAKKTYQIWLLYKTSSKVSCVSSLPTNPYEFDHIISLRKSPLLPVYAIWYSTIASLLPAYYMPLLSWCKALEIYIPATFDKSAFATFVHLLLLRHILIRPFYATHPLPLSFISDAISFAHLGMHIGRVCVCFFLPQMRLWLFGGGRWGEVGYRKTLVRFCIHGGFRHRADDSIDMSVVCVSYIFLYIFMSPFVLW